MKRALLLVLLTACGSKKAAHDDAGPGSGGSGSAATEITKLDAACNTNDAEACRKLAIVYEEGLAGTAQDHTKATLLFRKACDAKSLAACNQLALAISEGIGVPKNPAVAVEVYQRTCDAGYQLACRNLGLMVRDGRGVTADLARAATLLDGACTKATPYACTNAGDLDAQRAKTAPDDGARAQLYKEMIAHYKRGCDDGDPTSCRNLGVAYLEGKAIAASTTAASVWLAKACKLDEPIGCRVLGAMTVQGVGVEKDFDRGMEMLKRACDRKDTEACSAIETLGKSAAGSNSGSGSTTAPGSGSAGSAK